MLAVVTAVEVPRSPVVEADVTESPEEEDLIEAVAIITPVLASPVMEVVPEMSILDATRALVAGRSVRAARSIATHEIPRSYATRQRGAVWRLVEMLSDKEAAAVAAAAAIENLATSKDAALAIIRSGALPGLVKLKAVGALDRLAAFQASKVVAAGAVPVLIDLLPSALNRLAEDYADVIVRADGIPALVAALKKTGDIDAQRNAASALASLCCKPHRRASRKKNTIQPLEENIPALIVEAGAIDPLILLLTSCPETAAAALWSLADVVAKEAMIDAVKALVDLLTSGTPVAKEHAAGLLHRFNTEVPLRPVVDLLSSGRRASVEHAAGILALQNSAALVDAGAIPPLVRVLAASTTSTAAKNFAVEALAKLATNKIGLPIAQAGGISALLKRRPEEDTRVQVALAALLVDLNADKSSALVAPSSSFDTAKKFLRRVLVSRPP